MNTPTADFVNTLLSVLRMRRAWRRNRYPDDTYNWNDDDYAQDENNARIEKALENVLRDALTELSEQRQLPRPPCPASPAP